MRRLSALFLALVAAASSGYGEQVRVTTWNLAWFPAGGADEAPPDVEQANIEAVASALNSLQPDVVLLQEVRDKEACEQLAEKLGPAAYEVNVCSVFKNGGGPASAKRQLAILSRYPVLEAKAGEWQPEGAFHPPGGFAFVALRCGSVDVGFFTLHLKNNVGQSDRSTQFNILLREICAGQLVQQMAELSDRSTNRLSTLVVAGNFNTDLDQPRFISEQTLHTLLEAGFRHGFDGVPLAERITCPGRGRYLDATFDYVFAKGASFVTRPEIFASEASDHHSVTADLVLLPETPVVAAVAPAEDTPAESAPVEALTPALTPALAPIPVPLTRRANWPLYTFLGVLLALHLAIWAALRRRRATAAAEAAGTHRALGGPFPGDEENVLVPWETADKLEGAASAAGEDFARAGAGRAATGREQAAGPQRQALVRSGLLPHLARLLMNRVVQGLLSQRSQLLDHQQSASAQIAEMERRLARLQVQLQQRLTAYEVRIAELQQEIAVKEQENRQLRETGEHATEPEGLKETALPREPVLRTSL